MTTQTISNDLGDVTVTRLPKTTRYYRGRYFRTELSMATTGDGFRMTWRDTFYGQPIALRWFYMADGSNRAMHFRRMGWVTS